MREQCAPAILVVMSKQAQIEGIDGVMRMLQAEASDGAVDRCTRTTRQVMAAVKATQAEVCRVRGNITSARAHRRALENMLTGGRTGAQ